LQDVGSRCQGVNLVDKTPTSVWIHLNADEEKQPSLTPAVAGYLSACVRACEQPYPVKLLQMFIFHVLPAKTERAASPKLPVLLVLSQEMAYNLIDVA
jgi:hypothetical protein